MRDLKGKRVLVTGAADGIGRGAALAFARQGSRLALVDIDGAKLDSVAVEVGRLGAECATYVADVSDAAAVSALAAEVERDFGGLDVLVNVAGVCIVGDIADTPLEDWDWILGVNLLGPIHTIREFLPGMRGRGAGHILNVASAGGLVPMAMIGAYCTTKAGLIGLSRSLAQEVFDDGVRVTAFCPGLTRTGIVSRMRFQGYSREKMLAAGDTMMRGGMSAEKTGERIVLAVMREKSLVVTTNLMKAVALLMRLSPGLVMFVLTRGKKLNERLYRP